MPQLICEECRTQLKKSYSFKTLCKRSDDSLKLYLATGILRNGDRVIEVKIQNILSFVYYIFYSNSNCSINCTIYIIFRQ